MLNVIFYNAHFGVILQGANGKYFPVAVIYYALLRFSQ